eukprot:gene13829-29418_t
MKFSEAEIACCVKVGRSARVVKVQAGIFKGLLISRKVFPLSTTHAEVVGNTEFMDLLHKYIMLGFSEDATESIYGRVGDMMYFSDFTLLQILPRDIVKHYPDISAQDNTTLMNNRRNALYALNKMRESMIIFMNFVDTPLPSSPTKTKKEVTQRRGDSKFDRISGEHDDVSDVTTDLDMVSIESRTLRQKPAAFSFIHDSAEFSYEDAHENMKKQKQKNQPQNSRVAKNHPEMESMELEEFSEAEIACCVKVGRYARVVKLQAGIFKGLLISRKVFTLSTTHAEVVGNTEFMDLLRKYIMLGFSEDATESIYGRIFPRDIVKHYPDISAQDNTTLMNNRRNALYALNKMRESMIIFMNFVDTPLPSSPTKTKKEVTQSLTESLVNMSQQSNNQDD